jgi:1,4-dihydroxy-2-naphthoate octaprenyltransferase
VVIALALQIGTNYANDYSDGVRGTDEVRVGPFRLTASKLVPRPRVRNAAFCGSLRGVAGLWLASRTSWWLVLIGATAVCAGWFYTGGPKPYGYFGFGELFVFVYFGFVATVGTAYVQHLTIPSSGVVARSRRPGFMACALLEANNLRDVDGDRASGRRPWRPVSVATGPRGCTWCASRWRSLVSRWGAKPARPWSLSRSTCVL